MQKKRLVRNTLLNKIHRGAVYTCLGVTIYGTLMMCMRAYRYYTVVKPEREKADLKMIAEGSHDKAKELNC